MYCLIFRARVWSRDEPPFVPAEERPVARNMSQELLRKFGYTASFAKCRKLSRNEYSHPGLAQSQDCRTRIEASSRTDPVYRDRVERAEQRKMDFHAKEVERIAHPRRVSLEPSVVPETSTEEKDSEDHSSSRDVKRPRGNQNRTCQVKYLFQVQMRR